MKYLILGVGYTGKRIIELLEPTEHQVAGTHTGERNRFNQAPVYPFRLGSDENFQDIIHDLGWENDPYHLIFTAGPPKRETIDESIELLRSFLSQLNLDQLLSFSFISSTSVYGDADGDWVDETSPLEPLSRSGRLKVRAETELTNHLEGKCPFIVSRPGGIYGPERNGFRRYIEDYELVGGGEKWTNRIHVIDLARSILFLCEREENNVVNTVDGNPVKLHELVEFVHKKAGKDPENIPNISWEEAEERYSEMRLGLLKPNKRVSAEKIKNMGFEFRYPTVYEGLEAILEDSDLEFT